MVQVHLISFSLRGLDGNYSYINAVNSMNSWLSLREDVKVISVETEYDGRHASKILVWFQIEV